MYTALAQLQPGDQVPDTCYIADYADGGRPGWTVAARRELGGGGVQLLLIDPANGDMFDRPAVIVLAFPAKCLRTPVQLHGATGPAIISNKLCDLGQQARAAQRSGRREAV